MKWVEINPEHIIHCILNGAGTKIRKEYNSHILKYHSIHLKTFLYPKYDVITSYSTMRKLFLIQVICYRHYLNLIAMPRRRAKIVYRINSFALRPKHTVTPPLSAHTTFTDRLISSNLYFYRCKNHYIHSLTNWCLWVKKLLERLMPHTCTRAHELRVTNF